MKCIWSVRRCAGAVHSWRGLKQRRAAQNCVSKSTAKKGSRHIRQKQMLARIKSPTVWKPKGRSLFLQTQCASCSSIFTKPAVLKMPQVIVGGVHISRAWQTKALGCDYSLNLLGIRISAPRKNILMWIVISLIRQLSYCDRQELPIANFLLKRSEWMY